MSINNIYCNTKIYNELYKKGRREELHNNPENLRFYLLKKKAIGLDNEIIKKQNFKSAFGQVEIAIIGSSHYFSLENNFMEIISCSDNRVVENQLYTAKIKEHIQFKTSFDELLYSISVQSTEYANIEDFVAFEKMLLERQDVLIHAFEQKSAITAVYYLNTDKQFLLQSWHTYPKYRKIVFSESLLKKAKY